MLNGILLYFRRTKKLIGEGKSQRSPEIMNGLVSELQVMIACLVLTSILYQMSHACFIFRRQPARTRAKSVDNSLSTLFGSNIIPLDCTKYSLCQY
jgi:hypothetical protein